MSDKVRALIQTFESIKRDGLSPDRAEKFIKMLDSYKSRLHDNMQQKIPRTTKNIVLRIKKPSFGVISNLKLLDTEPKIIEETNSSIVMEYYDSESLINSIIRDVRKQAK